MKVSGCYRPQIYNNAWRTSWQWQPETYVHRTESGGDAGKVPPMIINTLSAPPAGNSDRHVLKLFMNLG